MLKKFNMLSDVRKTNYNAYMRIEKNSRLLLPLERIGSKNTYLPRGAIYAVLYAIAARVSEIVTLGKASTVYSIVPLIVAISVLYVALSMLL